MLIPKKTRRAILKYLFKEGVLVCRKDLTAKHPEIKVPNLYVIKLMFSLKSRGYVEEKFNWWFYYWWLTNEGMEYLREHLHLPESIVPATLKAPARQERPPQSAGERPPRSAPDSYVVSSRGPQGSFPPQTKEISTSSPEFRASFQSRGGRGGRGGGRGGVRGRGGYYRGDTRTSAVTPPSVGRGAPKQ